MQVTGLKPAAHIETSSSSIGSVCQLELQDPQDQDAKKAGQEVEDRNIVSLKEDENVKEEVINKEEEEAPPARLYSDWTRGSVRRVTQQLEQRMKQEHEAPSPTSSPPSVSCGTSSQRRSASFPSVSNPQDASVCLQGSVVSTVREELEEDDGKFGQVKRDVAEMGALGNNHGRRKEHKLKPADTSLRSTSSFHRFAPSPFASVNFLCLEGVTELESATDWDCPTEGPYSDTIMWETLCELGAFLQQVSVGCSNKARFADQVLGLGARSAPKRASGIQQRVREVEARIRQAGLTPPSLMKRSASLAKLGCLELLANDLSDWELSHSFVALPSAQSPLHTIIDESKKQRVHSSGSLANQQLDVLEASRERHSEAGETSPGATPASNHLSVQSCKPNPGQDPPHWTGTTCMTTRQQYGRTHPLRRLKKRTVSTLYHTM